MKKDELHARVLYLYQILRHYSDSEHPLTTQQILKIMDEKYHIQIHRVSVQNYVEILNSCGIKVNQQRAQDKYYYLEDRTFDIPELKLMIDAVQASRFIPKGKTNELIDKLLTLTSDYNADRLRKNIYFTNKVKVSDSGNYAIVESISKAIHAEKKISFQYFEYDVNKKRVLRHDGKGQKYVSKADEARQVEAYLKLQGVEYLELVVASSIGADLAMAFLTSTKLPIGHVFFDGGQFAQIGKGTRRMMTPFLYLAIKSLYWSKGGTLKKILWCDDDSIKSYFIAAGKNLTYTNLRRHILDSLEDKPFPSLPEELQKHIYFEFGSIEDHFKYRQAVMKAYPCGNYPVFEGYDHMQYQIREPKGFAEMLTYIAEHDSMPKLP